MGTHAFVYIRTKIVSCVTHKNYFRYHLFILHFDCYVFLNTLVGGK